MDLNKCDYKFYLDKDGKPVIEAGSPECQVQAVKALHGNEVTVTIAGVKAEVAPEPGPEPGPESVPEPASEPVPD